MLLPLIASLLMVGQVGVSTVPEKGVQLVGSTGCRTWRRKEDTVRRFECPKPLSLSLEERRAPLMVELTRRAGEAALVCGYVGLGDNGQAALECAERARKDKVAFLVAVQEYSWDTEAWVAAVSTDSGEGYFVRYETDPSGDMNKLPGFLWKDCQEYEFFVKPVPGIFCRK